MKIYAVMTSICCPEQYHGVTEKGDFAYIRYRHRHLTVRISDGSTDIYEAEPIVDVTFEDEASVVEELEKRGIKLVIIEDEDHEKNAEPRLPALGRTWLEHNFVDTEELLAEGEKLEKEREGR